MSPETHSQMASFIWSICNLLRGPYKRNEYRKVILPLTVLRRFDCILAPTKQAVLDAHKSLKGKSENIVRPKLCEITGTQFYNLSKLDFTRLLDDPNQLAPNLNSYINAFSPNVRQIMERFDFGQHVLRMAEKNILYEVVKAFADPKIDLSPQRIDNMQMGYIFEELIRIGAEQSNEEAGEHFTPREVIWLMVNLLLSDQPDIYKSHVVKTIYDPACGTGGMLSSAEQFLLGENREAKPLLYGQDWNDEAYAICKSDMLIKGEDADNVKLGDTFSDDGFPDQTFDYMLANPPFGVSWKQQQRFIEQEHKSLGYDGRFGAGLPRVNDGALLFLQHMISKMRPVTDGGSRIGIIFNGSPLFTGDACSPGSPSKNESEIRRWIIENDWLEGIVALPDQLFYNTGISTYIWIVTNRKTRQRKGKVQLLDARDFWLQMKKSLGNKRHQIGDGQDGRPDQIRLITEIYGDFKNNDIRTVPVNGGEKQSVVSKIFDNGDFGYQKITIERPLRLNFQATDERIARIDNEATFKNLATSNKKNEVVRQQEIAAGEARQQVIRNMLATLRDETEQTLYRDRKSFIRNLKRIDREVTGVKLSASELKAVLSALSERDEAAEVCKDRDANPEPDTELRDTEIVPLKESIEAYFEREVEPHVPDAWIDHSKTKLGYAIPLTEVFHSFEPPGSLASLEATLSDLERCIVTKFREVVVGDSANELEDSTHVDPRTEPYESYPEYRDPEVKWLGNVPQHWDVVRLKYLATINDEALSENTDPEYEFTYVDIGSVNATRGIVGSERCVFDDAPSRARRIVRHGDTIVSTVRTYLRAIAPIRNPDPDLIVSTGFAVLRPRSVDPDYMSFLLRSPYFIETVVSRSTGVSYPAVNASSLGTIYLPVPPREEQAAIAEFLALRTRQVDELQQAGVIAPVLEKYRAGLIEAATTGKIDVRGGSA